MARPETGRRGGELTRQLGLARYEERYRKLPELQRRAVRGVFWGLVFLLILAAFGELGVSAVLFVLVILALYVPRFGRLRFGRYVVPAAVLALAAIYPWYQDSLFTMPIFGEFPSVDTAVTMLIFIMMALGLNIVVGYAGLLDLGYVAFYAIGAYTAAWFASPHFGELNVHFGAVGINPTLPGIHVSIWLVLIIAAIFTAIVGVVIGLPTLRLRGDYLAIVTLGFGEILPQVARNGDELFGHNITNGAQGINPIDPPGFGALENVGLPGDYLTAANGVDLFYWTGLALVLLTVFCSLRLRDSRLGRAWIAIREDETAAAAMGVPLMRTKTWAYAAGAFFGGIAGAYYASFKSGTFPDDFFFNISVFILCMVILGGMGNIWGVILGGAFLAYLDKEGLGNIGGWLNDNLGVTVDIPAYSFGIYGAIIVIVMLFRPQGVIPSARQKAELAEGVHDEPLYDVSR
ncbi:MAG: branched-chain amino acid ABC transporter permease [Actinomycetota bacterium]|nr:branched-chain amino acid ABC transporter permease [Actinomycetota bacterium]